MRRKKVSLREAWEATKSHVVRTRPYGIDRQTELNTWCASYKETFIRIVPELLDQGIDHIPQIRQIVEQTQDRLIAEISSEWGTGK